MLLVEVSCGVPESVVGLLHVSLPQKAHNATDQVVQRVWRVLISILLSNLENEVSHPVL